MEFLEMYATELIYAVAVIINFIMSLVSLKKSGNVSKTLNSSIVESDLQSLIDYHQKTLDKLKTLKK